MPLEGLGQQEARADNGRCSYIPKGLHPTTFTVVRVGFRGGAGGAPFIDRVRAGTVGPQDLEIAFQPGELGELWALVCDGFENVPGPYPEVYKLAFELLHGPAPTVSGFTRVPGSVWAAEVRLERRQTAPTSEDRGEQTRFVLRATPQTGPAA